MARGQLPEPWKARQGFAFLFAFPNCACGFPGAAAGSGFHGRFCADLENRGRHKEATMELPLTRIKGGRRGGPGAPRTGQRSPAPPRHRGTPGAGQRVAGGRCAGTAALPAVGTCQRRGCLPEERSHNRCPQRQQLLRARRKWCKSWTQMFPLFSFPVIFSQLSTQLGGLLSPSSFPLHSGTVSLAAVPIQNSQNRGKPGKSWSPHLLQAQCH